MRTLIAFTLASVAALFSAGMEERFIGQASGWTGLIVFVCVYVIVIHRLTIQARHR